MIRPATSTGAAALAAVDEAAFPEDSWGAGAIADLLVVPGRRAWVEATAPDGGSPEPDRARGYVLTGLVGDFAEVLRIAVRPEDRRRGVARALLAAAVDGARRDGADRMLLEVSSANAAALDLYAAEGFTRIDVRPRYYRDGSDALVLERPLGHGREGSGRMSP